MTTNYRRGRDFEYRCRRALEEQAWPYVLRSAGSHTKIDLLALKRNHVPVAVQCKRDGRLAVDEWNRFYELCTLIGAFPVLACAEDKERGRGLEWWHITGKREPGSRGKPMERWEPRR